MTNVIPFQINDSRKTAAPDRKPKGMCDIATHRNMVAVDACLPIELFAKIRELIESSGVAIGEIA